MGAKVIVCGGRDYEEFLLIHMLLTTLDVDHVVHGGCPSGADHYADFWAKANKCKTTVFQPDWVGKGKSAGPLRNQEIADFGADWCIAFPGGRGTEDMVTRAKKAGIPVLRVETR
jgi:hypothetical protein